MKAVVFTLLAGMVLLSLAAGLSMVGKGVAPVADAPALLACQDFYDLLRRVDERTISDGDIMVRVAVVYERGRFAAGQRVRDAAIALQQSAVSGESGAFVAAARAMSEACR